MHQQIFSIFISFISLFLKNIFEPVVLKINDLEWKWIDEFLL